VVEEKVKWYKKRKMEREYCYFAVLLYVWCQYYKCIPLTDLLFNCLYVSLNQPLMFCENVIEL